MHACDIGNPCYKFEGYMNWCHLLSQEFQEQVGKFLNKTQNIKLYKFESIDI